MTNESNGGDEARAGAGAESRTIVEASKDPRNAIIDALLELASERGWDDITISDIASRA
ncbi:MAG: TetR/AcrR family transcriptional regulator, partial [Acidobacteria bacterium]|nr:TetR/AcrR family transcriptional regulator [Acidobacteriota bacterium]